MKITIVITLLNDERVFRTLESLEKQTVKPDEIIVADGGSTDIFQRKIKKFVSAHTNVVFSVYLGSISETRYAVMDDIINTTDIVVFIDADEIAPQQWLDTITKPIKNGIADFAGGPTKPYELPRSGAEAFINKRDDMVQENITSGDITQIAMGNSAWHTNVFKKIGNFDTFCKKYGISEDYDINMRAVRVGLKGKFIKDAWVYHDQSHLNTFYKLFKALYLRQVRTSIAYLKHGYSFSKVTLASRKKEIFHPFQAILYLSRPFAFIEGWIEWGKGGRK